MFLLAINISFWINIYLVPTFFPYSQFLTAVTFSTKLGKNNPKMFMGLKRVMDVPPLNSSELILPMPLQHFLLAFHPDPIVLSKTLVA